MSDKAILVDLKTDLITILNSGFNVLEKLSEDNKKLKLKAFKPSKTEAKIYLDYLDWEESEPKANFKEIYKREIEIVSEWLDIYCEEHNCSQEDALEMIIENT